MSRKYPDLYSPARSFISPPSFNILNRLCDTLVALTLAYSRHYPNIPFCPWLLGTEFVEHFFGLARSMLPNFTFTQLLSLVKHAMLRQQILLSGAFQEKRERNARAGYLFDFDNSPLSLKELSEACVRLTTVDIDNAAELGYTEAVKLVKDILHMPIPSLPFRLSPLGGPEQRKAHQSLSVDEESGSSDSDIDLGEGTEDEFEAKSLADAMGAGPSDLSTNVIAASFDAARDSALSDAHDDHAQEAEAVLLQARLVPIELYPPPPVTTVPQDRLLSAFVHDGKVSLAHVLDTRKSHQASTGVHSQRTTTLDPKFANAVKRVQNGEIKAIGIKPTVMSIREASHRVRIAQDVDPELRKPKTTRELNWQNTSKRVMLVLSTSM